MGGLTPEEQKLLDELAAVCKKHGPRLPLQTRQTCAVLKKTQELDRELKEAEARNAARHKLSQARMESVAYVTRSMSSIQIEGLLLVGSLIQASGDYDQILAARAAKPIAFEIMLALAFTALPELKLLSRAINTFVPKASYGWKAVVKDVKLPPQNTFETFIDNLRNINQARAARGATAKARDAAATFAGSLDNQAKDIIEAIRNPLKANDEIDAETKLRFAGHAAKNQILTGLIKDMQRALVAAMLVERITHAFIFWYEGEDVLDITKKAFNNSGLGENLGYKGSGADLLTELILYDMLRTYVRTYVSVWSNWSLEGLTDNYVHDVQGLDKAQLLLIYERFRVVPWKDNTRPSVANIRDLVRHWKGGELTRYIEEDTRDFPQAF